MILGVMADTHNNHVLMLEAARLLTRALNADRIIHLGDDYEDGTVLAAHGFEVAVVPGLWCPEYQMPQIPKRMVEHLDGLTLVAVHAAKDLRSPDFGASIILTGHTHQARIELIDGTLHVNPGHLKSRESRGEPATVATVALRPHEAQATIHGLNGETIRSLTVPRTELA